MKIVYLNEGNDIYSLIMQDKNKKYFMENGKFIIDCLNNEYNKDEILNLYCQKFFKNEDDAYEEILTFLLELELFGIIENKYSERLGFKNERLNNNFYFLYEKDVIDVSNFILKNIYNKEFVYSAVVNNDKFYSPYSLRARTFNNKEVYIYKTNEYGEIESLIGLQFIDEMPCVVILLIAPTDDKLIELMEYSENYIKKRNTKKIKLNCYAQDFNNELRRIEKVGFKREAVLVKEYKQNDLLIYSKFIN